LLDGYHPRWEYNVQGFRMMRRAIVRVHLIKTEKLAPKVNDIHSARLRVRPRKDRPGVALISDVLPFGRLWYGEPNAASNAVSYATHYSRSHDALIRVYDAGGNVIETHQHAGDFKEW
jgi:hypothetical protein